MQTVSIAFLGDISLHGRSQTEPIVGPASDLFASGIDVVGNVECCVSDRGAPKATKYACLRAPPSAAAGLSFLSVAVLANNHISDYGSDAAEDTVTNIQASGVEIQGYGATLEDALRPLVLDRNGVRVGIVSYSCPTTNGWNAATPATPGVAPLSMSIIREQIQALRSSVDALFVYLHWGVERSHYPTAGQIAAARRIVEWGGDVIIGAHAHVIQPYEKYRDGYIFYGLGNAVFGDVAYRQWSIHGHVSSGTLKQRPENLESISPLFRVEKGRKSRVVLDDVNAFRFENGMIGMTSLNSLTVQIKNLNRKLKVHSSLRKWYLGHKAVLQFRILQSGWKHYCAYSDCPIDEEPIWRLYYRGVSSLRSSVRWGTAKARALSPFRSDT